ncbi:hypothetical protein BJV74DRAFT_985925 [Russula compacta]|nr:hypothetical protein BJV74DRAFT_985925 [Russula compacta]
MSSPQAIACPAVKAAIQSKGISLSNLATSVGTSESRVNEILSGKAPATQQEYTKVVRSVEPTGAPDLDEVLESLNKITQPMGNKVNANHHLRDGPWRRLTWYTTVNVGIDWDYHTRRISLDSALRLQ